MTPGLGIGIGIGFLVAIFFIPAGGVKNLDDTRLRVIYFLDDASRFAVASSILKLQPGTWVPWQNLHQRISVPSVARKNGNRYYNFAY